MAVPDGEITYETDDIFPDYIVTARDMDGNTVYTANFTRRDISSKKTYSVVIPPTAKGAEQSDNVTGK